MGGLCQGLAASVLVWMICWQLLSEFLYFCYSIDKPEKLSILSVKTDLSHMKLPPRSHSPINSSLPLEETKSGCE